MQKSRRLTAIAVLFSSTICVATVGANTPQKVEQKRAAQVQLLYSYLPVASTVLDQSNVAANSIFAPAVVGRVTPFGVAGGLRRVEEYFFGAVKVLDPNAQVSNIHFNSIVARDDQVWVDVNIPVTTSQVFQSPELHEVGFFRFNDSNQIVSFDLTITQFATAIATVFDPGDAATNDGLIAFTCHAVTGRCTALPQFADANSCIAFMHSIPLGSWDHVSDNSFVCRSFHAGLLPYFPEIECASVGPTGGDTCNDHPYSEYFQTSF